MKRIYLDNAATTKADPDVVEAMLPYYEKDYGNASSLHYFGRKARRVLEESRERVADLINARKREIIFTGGGTGSDNIAILGAAAAYKERREEHPEGPHIITTPIEHPAAYNPCKALEKRGFEVKYLSVDENGLIDPEELANSITPATFLVTIIYGNNEIGTIQPIEEIGNIAEEKGVLFHTDAVQAFGKIPLDVEKERIDLLSLSSHKIYGPKGVGALYKRRGAKIKPVLHGGGHESGLRPSTENIPGIVGLAKAVELAGEKMGERSRRITYLRDKLIKGVLNEVERSYLNGHPEKRLPNNANFRFTAIEGESLVLALDKEGIAASTGSACSSKSLEPSRVLTSIGLNPVEAHGSLRMTLGKDNTEEDIDRVLKVLPGIVGRLRDISPLWGKELDLAEWSKKMEDDGR